MEWRPILSAPFNRDLQIAVINQDGVHALVFPCRRVPDGWMKKESGERISVGPTHWRAWYVAD